MEGYAEKLAAASRQAERMVKEFEELGAGEPVGWGALRPRFSGCCGTLVAVHSAARLGLLASPACLPCPRLRLSRRGSHSLACPSNLLSPLLPPVMGDLGLSLVKLAKYEDEEGSKCGQYSELGVGARAVGADARRVGLAAVRQSRLARAANAQVGVISWRGG